MGTNNRMIEDAFVADIVPQLTEDEGRFTSDMYTEDGKYFWLTGSYRISSYVVQDPVDSYFDEVFITDVDIEIDEYEARDEDFELTDERIDLEYIEREVADHKIQ